MAMNYPQAAALILMGHRVRRLDWNRPLHVGAQTMGGVSMVVMTMRNGVVGPYTVSHCDFFATDWVRAD